MTLLSHSYTRVYMDVTLPSTICNESLAPLAGPTSSTGQLSPRLQQCRWWKLGSCGWTPEKGAPWHNSNSMTTQSVKLHNLKDKTIMENSKLPLLYRNINHGYEPYYEVEAFKEAAEKMCFHGRAGRFVTWRNEPMALSVIKKNRMVGPFWSIKRTMWICVF